MRTQDKEKRSSEQWRTQFSYLRKRDLRTWPKRCIGYQRSKGTEWNGEPKHYEY